MSKLLKGGIVMNGFSNPNSNRNNNSNKEDRKYYKMMETSYNMGGNIPSSSVWNLSENDIKAIILKTGKIYIPEFKMATLEINDTESISAYLWLPINSKHISDSSLVNNSEVAIKGMCTILHKSDVLNDFTNRFCPKGKNRPIPEDAKEPTMFAIAVSVQRIFEVYYDKSGIAFQKEFGYKPPECRITARLIFQGRNDRQKFKYLEVTKAYARVADKSDPVPRKPFSRL